MSKMGFLELIVMLMAAAAVIGAYVLAFAKLLKSGLSLNAKLGWTLAFVFFNLLGLVAFLIYHDYYLRREFRTNF